LTTAPRSPALRAFVCLCLVALSSPVRPALARDRTLRVASKTFTESVIVAKIVSDLERAAGVEVVERSGLGGTRLVWNALIAGSVDVYPEYTGTLANEIFATEGAPPHGSDGELRRFLVQALAERGIGMTEPLGFNNTYAVGLTAARARALGVRKLSDLRGHPELRFGVSNEFLSRHDGWPALRERYGLTPSSVQGLDHDLAYRALTSGSIDASDVYTTDAEVRRYALVLLADDWRFFQRYDAVLLYRLEIRERVGREAVAALMSLAGRIDESAMAAMNARAKFEHVPEAQVAAGFVRDVLHLTPTAAAPRPWTTSLARTLEHLELVGVSLAAAILVAVPLGIVAARRPRLGRGVLALVSMIQTLPTLALLVFMIPLFGIGALPAMVALFLYSLLPIVRNTHAGVTGVPASLLESARALGLSRGAVLRRIELPLASPVILAGIKSAAVINVGTATLGALIGAGGLGQPIFTGIRLDDIGLILQGAIPASLLALAVQGGFELLARHLVPRGLRLPHSR
jgi:osmoprotectant transport system permease protein